jgi:repressor LexA
MLSPRQNDLVKFMRRCLRKAGSMPTVAEIQKEFGYSSPATVTTLFDGLFKKRVIERQPGKHRNLKFTPDWQPRETVDIPFLGSIPAGYPDDAEFQTNESIAIDVTKMGVAPGAKMFALKVSGNSMAGAGILDGDMVILEKNDEPKTEDIVAALIDGQTTLKRFLIRGSSVFLRAENPKYPDLIPANDLLIQGVMRALVSISKR